MGLFCRTIASRRSDFMHIDHRAGVLHTDHCPPSRRFPTHTNRPPSQRTAQLDARACAARPKGKYSRGRMALAPIRARRIFPATGAGRQVARATPCFHPIDFYVTHRFFGTFLTQESTVIPVSPLVSPHQNAPGRISAGRNEFALEAAVEGAALTAYARSPRGRTDRPCRPL